ncbi:hypothetical protein VTN77DRAFT_7300 [Rasamsonia byssochlamydoides]|uniref:uncharacterized protein n=1 Tax=Rasamsonia byssochlamydoides TaxID=89139 RepID=UPI0037421BF7
MSVLSPQPEPTADNSPTRSPPSFPLSERPKLCWAGEHEAPPLIKRRTRTFKHPELGEITRPYYMCTTCDSNKTNVFRNCGYPRGFVTWDDDIGLHSDNPRCYCGVPSRQDRKCRFTGLFGDGFWICASGACGYYSDRKDGVPYDESKTWGDYDAFRPELLGGMPAFC